MSVQPSIVIHWKTVSIANSMLSKFVIPKLGPFQYSEQTVPFGHCLPLELTDPQTWGSSPYSAASTPELVQTENGSTGQRCDRFMAGSYWAHQMTIHNSNFRSWALPTLTVTSYLYDGLWSMAKCRVKIPVPTWHTVCASDQFSCPQTPSQSLSPQYQVQVGLSKVTGTKITSVFSCWCF